MKYVFHNLLDYERDVTLVIDEICLNKTIEYKSGHVYGMTSTNEAAKSIVAFMLSPIKSKISEVIDLSPVNGLKSSDLHHHTLTILLICNDNNINVIAIITDNHRVIRSFFPYCPVTNLSNLMIPFSFC